MNSIFFQFTTNVMLIYICISVTRIYYRLYLMSNNSKKEEENKNDS